jgi:hypothetical protein
VLSAAIKFQTPDFGGFSDGFAADPVVAMMATASRAKPRTTPQRLNIYRYLRSRGRDPAIVPATKRRIRRFVLAYADSA